MTRRALPPLGYNPRDLIRSMSGAGSFEPIGSVVTRVLRDAEHVRAVERGCTDALAEITDEAYRRDNERLAAEIERLQASEYRRTEETSE